MAPFVAFGLVAIGLEGWADVVDLYEEPEVMRVAMLAGLPARWSIHVALDRVEAAGKQIKVRLDAEHARKLAELAAERHVEEVELAGELLAAALDDFWDGRRSDD